MKDPTRSWKLSPMDLESRSRWVEYSKAKDAMFAHTDTKQSPWRVVQADNKKSARLNCIRHLLSVIHYEDLTPTPPELPPRPPPKTTPGRRSKTRRSCRRSTEAPANAHSQLCSPPVAMPALTSAACGDVRLDRRECDDG